MARELTHRSRCVVAKGTCRWKAPRIANAAPCSRTRGRNDLGGQFHFDHHPPPREAGASRLGSGRDKRCQRLDRVVHAGKTTPCDRPNTIRRSGPGVVKTQGPPGLEVVVRASSWSSPGGAREAKGESSSRRVSRGSSRAGERRSASFGQSGSRRGAGARRWRVGLADVGRTHRDRARWQAARRAARSAI